MIKTSPQNLTQEVTAAETVRDRVLEFWKEIVFEYTGPAYAQDGKTNIETTTNWSPEAHAFEYISLMVPRLVHDCPRFNASSRRGGDFRLIAAAMKHGLNRWARDSRLRDVIREVAVDACIAFGVMHVTLEAYDKPDTPGARMRPRVERVPPTSWFCDPLALTMGACRYQGHHYPRDISDVLKEAEDPNSGWDLAALKDLSKATADATKLSRAKGLNVPDREEFVCTEVWVPEYQVEGYSREDGYHGAIFTLVEGHSGGDVEGEGFIRAPRPFYGSPDGPYCVMGVYVVPNRPYPLGPIQATHGQSRQLNDQSRAMHKAAASYKRLVLVSAQATKLKEAIAAGEHDGVIAIPGLKEEDYIVVEVGGLNEQMVSSRNILRDVLDRVSGISDAQRGSVTGDASATENTIAAEASETRTGYVKQQVANAVINAARQAGWYLWNTDAVIFSLGEDAANELGAVDPVFVGGSSWITGYTFEDLEIEIAPFSLERVNEAVIQTNTLKAIELTINAAPVIRQFPELHWKEMWRSAGATLGVPMEDWINPEASAMLLGLQQPIVNPDPVARFAGDRQPSDPRMGGGPRVGNNQKPGASAPPQAQPQPQRPSNPGPAKPAAPQGGFS